MCVKSSVVVLVILFGSSMISKLNCWMNNSNFLVSSDNINLEKMASKFIARKKKH